MRKRLIPLAILFSILWLAAIACGEDAPTVPPTSQPTSPPVPEAAPATQTAPEATEEPASPASPAASAPGTMVTVELMDSGGRGPFEFGPADLSFAVGETVEFTLNAEFQFHTFTVEDLGIDEAVDGGETGTLSFTFDQPGTYTLICIPHEALGMVGTITVTGDAGAQAPASTAPAGTAVTIDGLDGGGRGPFAFGPAELSFAVGETVEFTFIGESQFHTFTVDELGIDEAVEGGETVTFSFTFDQPGTYSLICVPHLALGMVGTTTVQ